LSWSYHRLVRWIKKDKGSIRTKGLAVKVGWNWLLKPEAISIIKELEGQLKPTQLNLSRKKNKRK
jgi:hypothetical protein